MSAYAVRALASGETVPVADIRELSIDAAREVAWTLALYWPTVVIEDESDGREVARFDRRVAR